MPSQSVSVGSRNGLDAAPAALIAEAVNTSGVPVTLATPGGAPVDAASASTIMALGARQGTEVVVTSEDATVLERIAGLVARDLATGR
jgi:phosphocarrier protein